MDTKKILEFRAHYEYMPEEEIALLHANPHLSEEAKVALNEVIHARKIDLAKIRQEEAEEEFQIDEKDRKSVV